jgi:diacylglycerol O-acyltransferase
VRASRLTPLDSSFLAVESPAAHMHVGWIAIFDPPTSGSKPSFERLREHIAARLDRVPRYRQRLAEVPLNLASPAWVDDPDFDVDRHVVRARTSRLSELAAESLSTPLPHDRPLWQITVADQLEGGGVGIVGKAHHCMVDGIAAVELASLLLDPDPDPEPIVSRSWRPQLAPQGMRLLRQSAITGAVERLRFAAESLTALRSPSRIREIPHKLHAVLRAALDSARPALRGSSLNEQLSPARHVAFVDRPLAELKQIKRAHGTTLNDVLLAVAAGALRSHQVRRGEVPASLKAMVPVNVRHEREHGPPGNRISFMFVDLPCDERDGVRRLREVHAATLARKHDDVAAGSETLLDLAAQTPRPVRGPISRVVASPRTFNLVVSNIPGPAEPLYMAGCRLQAAYPIVPLAERHDLSIGMTTIRDRACFGLYADRESLPDVDMIATSLEDAIDDLAVGVGDDPRPSTLPLHALTGSR